MANIPAICDNCGTIFPSGLDLRNSIGVQFRNVGAGPCPKCGESGTVLDGMYDTLGESVHIVLSARPSKIHLKALLTALQKSTKNTTSHEVREAIAEHAPELTKLADLIPTNRNEVYGFIQALGTIIALILAGYAALFGPQQITQQQVNEI